MATSWRSGEVSRGRSSGWIRAVTARIKAEVSQTHEGPNVEVFQMPLGSSRLTREKPSDKRNRVSMKE